MLIYKFRITFEENDDFLREIDVLPKHTFADFHKAILKCVSLTPDEPASFFMCDIKWKKHQEITLKKDTALRDDPTKPPIKIMSKTTLSSLINNPNEQLIYIYDSQKLHTFYIELFKIFNSVEKVSEFPRCVKSIADVPKTIKIVPTAEGIVLPEEDEPADFEDEFEEEEIIDEDASIFGDVFEDLNSTENM